MILFIYTFYMKIFFMILILIFSLININSVGASSFKDTILAKNELSKSIKWKKYIAFVDKISIKYWKDEAKLRKLEKKVFILKQKLEKDNSIKNKDIKNVINYLYWKLKISIINHEKITNIDVDNNVVVSESKIILENNIRNTEYKDISKHWFSRWYNYDDLIVNLEESLKNHKLKTGRYPKTLSELSIFSSYDDLSFITDYIEYDYIYWEFTVYSLKFTENYKNIDKFKSLETVYNEQYISIDNSTFWTAKGIQFNFASKEISQITRQDFEDDFSMLTWDIGIYKEDLLFLWLESKGWNKTIDAKGWNIEYVAIIRDNMTKDMVYKNIDRMWNAITGKLWKIFIVQSKKWILYKVQIIWYDIDKSKIDFRYYEMK